MKSRGTKLRVCVVVLALAAALSAQVESGKFRLHKFEQPIGEESYTITTTGATLSLQTSFSFTDRGTEVPLQASFTGSSDYTPQRFSIKGSTSRSSQIDDAVNVTPSGAQILTSGVASTQPIGTSFFTIAGYAPVAMQMALMRYWQAHGSPSSLQIVPLGEVEITDRGADNFNVDGRAVTLRRYSLKGLVWGLETLWMDQSHTLAAVVTRDAEFDHFEAIAEPYESALPAFVRRAADDSMAELTAISKQLPGRRTGTLAFRGATVIDGTARPPIADAIVITRNGKIAAAGPAGKIQIPKDATVIDISGKYIIPGLWDMHAHYEQVEWGPIYLAAGVTSVRDMGNEFEFITAVRDRIRAGDLGPNLLLAGIVDGDGPLALGIERVNSAADAARWVKTYHDAGFQQMKIYSSVTADNVKAICADAHALGMTVTGHIPEGMTIYDGVNDGMDQVAHIPYVYQPLLPPIEGHDASAREQRAKAFVSLDFNAPPAQQLIHFLKDHGTVIDDTTALFELFMHPDNQPISSFEPGITHVAPELRDEFTGGGVPPEQANLAQVRRRKTLELIGALHRAGVTLVAGTDQAVPGYSVYRELELYVEAGFTPLEAVQAATVIPAHVMKMDAETGTIEPGKRADFDILERDPLADIHNIRSVRSVVANGILFDSAPLWKSVGFAP